MLREFEPTDCLMRSRSTTSPPTLAFQDNMKLIGDHSDDCISTCEQTAADSLGCDLYVEILPSSDHKQHLISICSALMSRAASARARSQLRQRLACMKRKYLYYFSGLDTGLRHLD